MLDNNANLHEIINEINSMGIVIGDVPVSEQLASALDHMALKEHTHEEYVPRSEVEALRREVQMLLDLVGDVSVSEQINAALTK